MLITGVLGRGWGSPTDWSGIDPRNNGRDRPDQAEDASCTGSTKELRRSETKADGVRGWGQSCAQGLALERGCAIRRGPEFTWEREDSFKKKYPQLFTNRASSSTTSSHVFASSADTTLLSYTDSELSMSLLRVALMSPEDPRHRQFLQTTEMRWSYGLVQAHDPGLMCQMPIYQSITLGMSMSFRR
ncbi:hypothetical protein Tco_0155079 [Tanacetum coccineum]